MSCKPARVLLHSFFYFLQVSKPGILHIHVYNSRHLARKYARIFVLGHHMYLFREANSFPRAKLEENCVLRGTDSAQGQISDNCLCYLSNIFRNSRNFENWGIFSDIPQFQLGNIRSRDAFRPVARKQKKLMDYNLGYSPVGEYTVT